jgi:MinD-like ATPase involved in chromosome partitioning or flagellar assembly
VTVTVVAVASARSSAGATRLSVALASAWHEHEPETFLLEADADGGVLAARLGLAVTPNLTELAGRARSGVSAEVLRACAQPGPGGLPVVVAHPSPEQTTGALRAAAARLVDGLRSAPVTAVVDIGRLRHGSPGECLADAADAALVVVRAELDDLTALANRLVLLPASGATGLVLVGQPTFRPSDVEQQLGVPVVAVLDDRAARRRDPFADGARQLATRLRSRLRPETEMLAGSPWPAPVPA